MGVVEWLCIFLTDEVSMLKHSCSTLPADVHEGIPLLSKIPKFEHHSIASGGYHSVRSLTVLVDLNI
jgi:hypothetical protein